MSKRQQTTHNNHHHKKKRQCNALQSYKYSVVDKENKANTRCQKFSMLSCVHMFAVNTSASSDKKGFVQQVVFNKRSSQ